MTCSGTSSRPLARPCSTSSYPTYRTTRSSPSWCWRRPDSANVEVDCRPSDAIAVAVRGGQLVTGADGEEHWFESVQEAQGFIDKSGYDAGDERNEVRSKVPIYVEDGVLDRAGILMDADGKDGDDALTPPGQRRARPGPRSVTQEEMDKDVGLLRVPPGPSRPRGPR